MHISAITIDDLLRNVFEVLLKLPFNINSSRSNNGLGASSEIIGATLTLTNPRARISRDEVRGNLFSGIGELLWYLSKDNSLKFIQYYIPKYTQESEDGKTIHGGYGPRLFNYRNNINQVQNIINLLKQKGNSRRAVIQIFDAEDLIIDHKEIPCTCTLQFFIREEKLVMYTSMRSNDAYIGLPHDIFAFTLLQEIVAKALNVSLGDYHHAVGSLHLYSSNKEDVIEYLNSGYHSTKKCMPPMPTKDPWPEIDALLILENDIRSGKIAYGDSINNLSEPYWLDFVHLLFAYNITKKRKLNDEDLMKLRDIKSKLSTRIYDSYLDKRINAKI